MLIKLLKYDFKSMFKIFVPLWVVLLLVSIGNNLLFGSPMEVGSEQSVVNNLMLILYGLLIVAVMVVTVVLVVVRFYQGLLKDEGYLMFTLPVSTWKLVASKLIAATVIYMVSTVVAVLSVYFLANFPGMLRIVGDTIHQILSVLPQLRVTAVLFVVTILVGIVCGITQIYAAMALGHLASKHRVAFSVLAFIVLNMAWSTVGTVCSAFLFPVLDVNALNTLEMTQNVIEVFNTSLVAALVISVVQTGVQFFLTHYILSRRLNLE